MEHKRWISSLIALVMVFMTVIPSFAAGYPDELRPLPEDQDTAKVLLEAEEKYENDFIKETKSIFKDEDEIIVFVVLKDGKNNLLSSLGDGIMSTRSVGSYNSNLSSIPGFSEVYGSINNNISMMSTRSLEPQRKLNNKDVDGVSSTVEYNINTQIMSLQELLNYGYKFSILDNVDYILNSYIIETDYKTAKEISKLDFVERVYVNKEYALPEEPNMQTSHDLINDSYAWDIGYDGTGMIAAVLDSGFDYEHPDYAFDEGFDMNQLKLKNEADVNAIISEKKTADGIWLSEKIPFAYNYVEKNTRIKQNLNDDESHGQHVAGTVVANGEIKGVAKNAQLLALRVFKEGSGTGEMYYIPAIDDAIKLGADSINMSLGSPLGATKMVSTAADAAFSRAIEAGAILSISAGNDGKFGGLNIATRADNPDYGVTGSPSASIHSISVAAAGNTHAKLPKLSLADGKFIPYSPTATTKGAFGKTLEIVSVGKGKEEDYAGKDVTGKAALIERGGSTFTEKINTAEKHGAELAIIYNHEIGGNTFIGMVIDGTNLPSMSILRNDALSLIENPTTVTVNNSEDIGIFPAEASGDMGDFSSWGPNLDYEFKPEIAAPGVDIYSLANDGRYTSMNGTSMAAPHLTGSAILVKQRLMKDFPQFAGRDLSILIKNMMMSTASPITDKKTNSIISTRKQGAGMVNIEAASKSNVYGINEITGLAKVNLKSNAIGKPFDIKLVNLGNNEQSYNTRIVVMTNNVVDGHFDMRSSTIYEEELGNITVPANGNAVKNIVINLDDAKIAELNKLMPNGFWVDAFVFFEAEGVPSLSIPVIGFSGDHSKIPVLEKSIYDMDIAGGDLPTYYDKTGETSDYTALISTNGNSYSVLGFDRDGNYENLLNRKDKIAISPNGDGVKDNVGLSFVANRNLLNLTFELYNVDQDGNATTLIPKVDSGSGMALRYVEKHAYMDREKGYYKSSKPTATVIRPSNNVTDGKYIARVSAYPFGYDVKDENNRQDYDYPIIIDREMPKVSKVDYDEATRLVTAHITDATPNFEGSGVYKAYYYYDDEVENGKKNINEIKVTDDTITLSFNLKEGATLENTNLAIVDWAGNLNEDSLQAFKDHVSYGKLIIETKVTNTEEAMPLPKYEIKNAEGEVQANLNRIKIGSEKYTVKVAQVPNGFKLVGEDTKEFTLSEDKLEAKVEFTFEKIEGAKYSVVIKIPSGVEIEIDGEVWAVDENGKRYDFTKEEVYAGSQYFDGFLAYGESYDIYIKINNEGYKTTPSSFRIDNFDKTSYTTRSVNLVESTSEYAINVTITGLPEGVKADIKYYNSSGSEIDDPTALAPGNYYVELNSMPEGYMADKTYFEVTLTEEEKIANITINFISVVGTKGSIEIIINNDTAVEFDRNDLIVEDFNGNIVDPANLVYGDYFIRVDEKLLNTKYKGYALFNDVNSMSSRLRIDGKNPNRVLNLTFDRLTRIKKEASIYFSRKEAIPGQRYPTMEDVVITFTNIEGKSFDKIVTSGFNMEKLNIPVDYYDISVKKIADGWDAVFEVDGVETTGLILSQFIFLDVLLKKATGPEIGKGSITVKFRDLETQDELTGAEFYVTKEGDTNFRATSNDELKSLPYATYNITITKAPSGYLMPSSRNQRKVVILDSYSKEREVVFALSKDPNAGPELPKGESTVKFAVLLGDSGLDMEWEAKLDVVDEAGNHYTPIRRGMFSPDYYLNNLPKGKYTPTLKNLPKGMLVEYKPAFAFVDGSANNVDEDPGATVGIYIKKDPNYNPPAPGKVGSVKLVNKGYNSALKLEEYISVRKIGESELIKPAKPSSYSLYYYLKDLEFGEYEFVVDTKGTQPIGVETLKFTIDSTEEKTININGPRDNYAAKIKIETTGLEDESNLKFTVSSVDFNKNIFFMPDYRVVPSGTIIVELDINSIPDGYELIDKNKSKQESYVSMGGEKIYKFDFKKSGENPTPNPGLTGETDLSIYVSTYKATDYPYDWTPDIKMTNENDEEFALTRTSQYSLNYKATALPAGTYKITISNILPGYKFDKDEYKIEIDGSKTTKMIFINILDDEPVVNKDELNSLLQEAVDVRLTEGYIYADEAKKAAYDNAILEGQKIADDNEATQAEVDLAVNAIKTAKEGLDGVKPVVNKDELNSLLQEAGDIRLTEGYIYADEAKKAAYDNAISEGQKIADNNESTQAEVDTAVNAIKTAKEGLDGVKPVVTVKADYSELKKLVEDEDLLKSDRYIYADRELKEAYDQFIKQAVKIIDNNQSTQVEVDELVKSIKSVIDMLNGLENIRDIGHRYYEKEAYFSDYYVKEAQNLIDKYKNIPGYKKAVIKLQSYLNSINPRYGVNNAEIKAMIESFKKDDKESKIVPVLKGDEKGNFNPQNNLTRAEFAVVMARLNNISLEGTTWYEAAMKFVFERGYMKGNETGDMMPNKVITIAEVVTIFNRYKNYLLAEGNTLGLPDGHWATAAMQRAYVDKWLVLIDNPSDVDRPITRQELASILTRVRQLTIDRDFINRNSHLYRSFPDVQKSNPFYYDIIVNAN
ncbi:MAG: S8 family serine peptidase [Firmicutes bacterium]|nr:S8 family serine peptidase [Bacillota bacterium]